MAVTLERGFTDDHLVDEDAEGPPVDGMRVAFVEDDFWRNVLGSSTDGIGPFFGSELFDETEVAEFEQTILHEENVLGFQVSVD